MNTKKDQDITEIRALISSIEQDVAMGWIPNQWLLSPLKAALTALESPPIGYIDPQSLNNFENGKSNKEWLWARNQSGLEPVYLQSTVAELKAIKLPPEWPYDNGEPLLSKNRVIEAIQTAGYQVEVCNGKTNS